MVIVSVDIWLCYVEVVGFLCDDVEENGFFECLNLSEG